MTLQGREIPNPIGIPEFLELLREFTEEFGVSWQLDGERIAFLHNFYYWSPLSGLFGRSRRPPLADDDIHKLIMATENSPHCDQTLRSQMLEICGLTGE